MSSTEHPSSIAMKQRKRATSKQPAWPKMRLVGKPEAFHAVYTMASRGFETTIITQLGEYLATCSATVRTICTLVAIKSSRLIPGLRGIPAVTTTTSESAVSA